MAENLWQLRRQRGMSAQQLAGKAGVPLASLRAYEQGEPIRASDISKLARALFVNEFAIKVRSDPKPEKPAPRPSNQAGPPTKSAQKEKTPSPEQMARPTQITHLLRLAEILKVNEEEVLAEAGKPLEELTLREMKNLLGAYTERVRVYKESHPEPDEDADRPPDTRRKRAHLPEGIDEFELNYLLERQEQGDKLTFIFLSGEKTEGQIIGFSAYSIAIRQDDGREVILQKLALAYYYREALS